MDGFTPVSILSSDDTPSVLTGPAYAGGHRLRGPSLGSRTGNFHPHLPTVKLLTHPTPQVVCAKSNGSTLAHKSVVTVNDREMCHSASYSSMKGPSPRPLVSFQCKHPNSEITSYQEAGTGLCNASVSVCECPVQVCTRMQRTHTHASILTHVPLMAAEG